jgi:putative phosphoribosyl transferase
MTFGDRAQAGQQLAQVLFERDGFADALVLALPRGGVPVAFEAARRLALALDVQVMRKLGVPGHGEYAFGAIASGGVTVIDDGLVRLLGLSPAEIEAVARTERSELQRRERAYRGGRPAHDVRGRKVLLVDDGLATGATMRAAVRAVRARHAAAVIAAAPVVSPEALASLRGEADEVLWVQCPDPFLAVGAWYDDFSQTTDPEVCRLLAAAREFAPEAHAMP